MSENGYKASITIIDEWMQSPSQTLKKDVDKFVDILEATSSIRLPEKMERTKKEEENK